ncbi:MAG: DUF2007 domain-containing protein [Actinomycetota bacterium]|jgi:hypothetical protein|nr:DUF2007 domain-containing protein [Euzebyaceae bacterium]MDQ3453307.1 DUF2007 domain-containing protein [Actinomycetota bacterium]
MAELRVLTARPSVQAQLIKGALEAEGIVVRLDRDALGSVYGLDSGTFATRVLVPAVDVERARRLLAELESADS